MLNARGEQDLPRYGVVATDSMRILGLRALLGDGERCEIVELSPPAAGNTANLAIALVDSPAEGEVTDLVAAFRRLRPALGVLVLGAESGFEHIERVIGAGAKGYLSHAASEAELKMAIDVVLDGSVWAPRKVLARLLEQKRVEPGPALMPAAISLTRRELEVIRLLVKGQPNRQIAQAMGVDEGTVKAHMGRLMRKANVGNRTALTMRAIEAKWTVR